MISDPRRQKLNPEEISCWWDPAGSLEKRKRQVGGGPGALTHIEWLPAHKWAGEGKIHLPLGKPSQERQGFDVDLRKILHPVYPMPDTRLHP
jgi:hypothetical protein